MPLQQQDGSIQIPHTEYIEEMVEPSLVEETTTSNDQAIVSSKDINALIESYTDIEVSMSSDTNPYQKRKISLPLSEQLRCESDISEVDDHTVEYPSIGEQSNPYAAKSAYKKTGIYEVEEASNESDHSDGNSPKTP